MTKKEFLNRVSNSHQDFLAEFINILTKRKISFCIIGGLAVNAYAEPVVSLDLDLVVVVNQLTELIKLLKKKYKVVNYPNPVRSHSPTRPETERVGKARMVAYGRPTSNGANSINISAPRSDLRIQLQTDPRYQAFIKKARVRNVLGYRLPVARIEDVFQGKVWSASDPARRPSKRQKDLSDIQRLMETKPVLVKLLTPALKKALVR